MAASELPVFTFLGHATVRCDLPSGEVVVIDPFLTENPTCPPSARQFERLDLILVTHAHGDHSGDVLSLAARFDPLVVATYDLCQWFAAHGVRRTSGMNLGGTQRACGLEITQVRADHTSSLTEDDGTIVYGGVASGFVVRLAGGFTFYHAGDTALFSDMALMAELWHPQLAFLPIGDHFTMGPMQAARACRFLNVPRVVPIHWGTFGLLTGTPADFARELAALGQATEVVTLQPGESWRPPD